MATGAGASSARHAVSAHLVKYHAAFLRVVASDADVVFQRAIEKKEWLGVTSVFDELPPTEQRVFATLSLIDDRREETKVQEARLRDLQGGVRRIVFTGQRLTALRADQTRREQHLKTLNRELETHWGRLT